MVKNLLELKNARRVSIVRNTLEYIDHNTFAQGHAAGIVNMDGPAMLGFVYTNSPAKHHSYGFIGADRGVGNDSIAVYLSGADIARNLLADGVAGRYPATNSFPSTAQFELQLVRTSPAITG